jgi:hypothetical protein
MKNTLLFIMVSFICAFGSLRTWSSGASTNANDGNNYTPAGSILETDTLLLNNTSLVAWIMTDTLHVAKINMQTTFTGTWNMGGYKLVTKNSLILGGVGSTLVMNAEYRMLDNGLFYIHRYCGSFSGTGSRVYLDGLRDSMSMIVYTIPSTNYISSLSVAKDSGSIFYYSSYSQVRSLTTGLGKIVVLEGSVYVTADTSHPVKSVSSTVNIEAVSSGGGLRIMRRWQDFFFAGAIYLPKIITSGESAVTFSSILTKITDTLKDTVIFMDSISTNSLRFDPGKKTVVYFRSYVNLTFGNFLTLTPSTAANNTVEMHFGHNVFKGPSVTPWTYGRLVNLIFYLDSSNIIATLSWDYSNPDTTRRATKSFLMYPGISTVNFNPIDSNISIRSQTQSFYNVICSTVTDKKITTLDSLSCNNNLKIKKGGFNSAYPVYVGGNFVDSTTDTCKLSSLYLSKDAHFSSLSILQWYPNAKIYAVGNGKQVIYTNGRTLPKIIAKKGSKLTVK